jgi:hypothetical protein
MHIDKMITELQNYLKKDAKICGPETSKMTRMQKEEFS